MCFCVCVCVHATKFCFFLLFLGQFLLWKLFCPFFLCFCRCVFLLLVHLPSHLLTGPNWLPLLSAGYVGLVNQAMTCYLNSLLQTLFMTPEFRNALYRYIQHVLVFASTCSFSMITPLFRAILLFHVYRHYRKDPCRTLMLSALFYSSLQLMLIWLVCMNSGYPP